MTNAVDMATFPCYDDDDDQDESKVLLILEFVSSGKSVKLCRPTVKCTMSATDLPNLRHLCQENPMKLR